MFVPLKKSVADATDPRPVADPTLRARRSPRLLALGLLLACLGGLGAALGFQQAMHSNQVVVVQHTVMRGSTLKNSDLAVVTVGQLPGVKTVPAARLSSLVGQQALVDLPGGSLLSDESVGHTTLPEGTAALGLKLTAGRVPASALPVGSRVKLIQVGDDKVESTATGLVVDATVLSAPERSMDGSARVLDVAVDQAQMATLADLAARDRVAIALVGKS